MGSHRRPWAAPHQASFITDCHRIWSICFVSLRFVCLGQIKMWQIETILIWSCSGLVELHHGTTMTTNMFFWFTSSVSYAIMLYCVVQIHYITYAVHLTGKLSTTHGACSLRRYPSHWDEYLSVMQWQNNVSAPRAPDTMWSIIEESPPRSPLLSLLLLSFHPSCKGLTGGFPVSGPGHNDERFPGAARPPSPEGLIWLCDSRPSRNLWVFLTTAMESI